MSKKALKAVKTARKRFFKADKAYRKACKRLMGKNKVEVR